MLRNLQQNSSKILLANIVQLDMEALRRKHLSLGNMSLLDSHEGNHDSILIMDISVRSAKSENGSNVSLH